MNKTKIINKIYNNLQDCLEYDQDVIAIYNTLKAEYKLNKASSLNRWHHLLIKYQEKLNISDINWEPLLNEYPVFIIKQTDFATFFKELATLPKQVQILINHYILNSFKKDSLIYEELTHLITNKDYHQELNLIKLVLSQNIDPYVFDLTFFLKEIITIHLNNDFNLETILKIIELCSNAKDKSILYSLIIDYL